MSLSHDQADHRFWGFDGAYIEATGRAPLVFTASIPFRNGIVPGKKEKWGVLYPTTYREFLRATADRGTGTLVHPEFGLITCKVRNVETIWDANRRDGCDVEATWVETIERDENQLTTDSTVTSAELAARDLDTHLQDLSHLDPPLPSQPTYQPDFEESMRRIAAVGDQISLLQQRQAGKIDSIIYRVNEVGNSLDRAATTSRNTVKSIIDGDSTQSGRSALSWPMRDAINRMKAGLIEAKKKLLEDGRPIVFYRVPSAATLASVSISAGANLSEMISLNPSLVRSPIVPIGTIVRYYAAAR